MITLGVDNDVEYGLLEASELDGMTGLLATAFSRHDPPAVAVGLPAAEIQHLVAAFGPKAVSEQLTVVARHALTGTIVGALLVEDFGTPPPAGLEGLAPTFAPIGSMLESLDAKYRTTWTVLPGAYLHLLMLGVADDFGGRGIAARLVDRSLAHGKKRGFTMAVTEATGSVSQHIFRKLGFRDVFVASYKEFVYAGEHVFASIVGPEGTILMERAV